SSVVLRGVPALVAKAGPPVEEAGTRPPGPNVGSARPPAKGTARNFRILLAVHERIFGGIAARRRLAHEQRPVRPHRDQRPRESALTGPAGRNGRAQVA